MGDNSNPKLAKNVWIRKICYNVLKFEIKQKYQQRNTMNLTYYLAQASSDAVSGTGAGCTINGQPASCSEAGGMAAIILIPMLLVGIVLFVFWVQSLIHVLKHNDVPNHTLWLILHFVGLGLLTGIIYKFAVKRPYDRSHASGANGQYPGQQMPQQNFAQPQFAAAPPQQPMQPQYQQPPAPYGQAAPQAQQPMQPQYPQQQPPQPPNQNTPGQF